MTAKAKKLLGDALKLSENERAELAEELLDSLESEPLLSQEWEEEINRRLRELDEGKAKAIPWSTVRRQMRSRVRKRRNAHSKP